MFMSYALISCLSLINQTSVLGSLLGNRAEFKDATPSQLTIMSVQAFGGIIAGATASLITTPLDTIKTRLQVSIILIRHWIIYIFYSLLKFFKMICSYYK